MMWNLRKYKGNTAVITDNGQYVSYEGLADLCDELAQKIAARSLVFCLCTNTIGSLIGYVSFLNHNIVPVMLDAHIDNELLGNFLNEYKPDYLWLPEEKAGDFSGDNVYSSAG